jgi:hypothetical protein
VSADDRFAGRADERPMLIGFLDWFRDVAVDKVLGLSDDDARRVMMPSGLGMLGVVQHLGWAERLWFPWRFAGEDVPGTETIGADNSSTFVLADDATVASVVAGYRASCDRSRAVVDAAPSLDAVAAREHSIYGVVSLRWILVHMIEETARHAGHLDIMREYLDGHTGD